MAETWLKRIKIAIALLLVILFLLFLGKTIGAICLAPVILAEAGVLDGRNATAIPSVAERLIDGGAKYVYEDVRDGNIVTGCAPHASRSFGTMLADNIKP
jgi:protease I